MNAKNMAFIKMDETVFSDEQLNTMIEALKAEQERRQNAKE